MGTKFQNFKNIIGLVSFLGFLAGAILVFIVAITKNEQYALNNLLGVCVILQGVPHLLDYISKKGYKKLKIESSYIVFALISFSLGFVFIFSSFTIQEVCLYWGLYDIIQSAFEFKIALIEAQENKFAYLNVILSLISIVIAVLLCVHRGEGITLHLFYLSASFLAQALAICIRSIIFFLKERKNKALN